MPAGEKVACSLGAALNEFTQTSSSSKWEGQREDAGDSTSSAHCVGLVRWSSAENHPEGVEKWLSRLERCSLHPPPPPEFLTVRTACNFSFKDLTVFCGTQTYVAHTHI